MKKKTLYKVTQKVNTITHTYYFACEDLAELNNCILLKSIDYYSIEVVGDVYGLY